MKIYNRFNAEFSKPSGIKLNYYFSNLGREYLSINPPKRRRFEGLLSMFIVQILNTITDKEFKSYILSNRRSVSLKLLNSITSLPIPKRNGPK